METVGLHAIFDSPLVRAAHTPTGTAFIAGGAAEPVAGGKPVHIMQNVADDLLDGAAEPHDLSGDAGDRASCLVDDVLRA
eukprot:354864-Prymnesium_polylepis.1